MAWICYRVSPDTLHAHAQLNHRGDGKTFSYLTLRSTCHAIHARCETASSAAALHFSMITQVCLRRDSPSSASLFHLRPSALHLPRRVSSGVSQAAAAADWLKCSPTRLKLHLNFSFKDGGEWTVLARFAKEQSLGRKGTFRGLAVTKASRISRWRHDRFL